MNLQEKKYHSNLSDYFLSKPLFFDEKKVNNPNKRKLVEQPWQQTNAERWGNLEKTICNLCFVEAKCKAEMISELVADYNRALCLKLKSYSDQIYRNTEAYLQFVLNQSYIINAYPELIYQQGFNQNQCEQLKKDAEKILEISEGKRPWLKLLISFSEAERSRTTFSSCKRGVRTCALSAINNILAIGDEEMEDYRSDLDGASDPDPWKVSGGTIKLIPFPWLPGNERIIEFKQAGVSSLDFSPDGKVLVAGLWDGTIRLYDIISLECLASYDETDEGISCCRFAPGGEFIAYTSRDYSNKRPHKSVNCLKIVRYPSMQSIFLYRSESGGFHSCNWSYDKMLLAASNEDGTISVFDVVTGTQLKQFKADLKGPVYSCHFVPNTHLLISVGYDHALYIWDLTDLSQKRSFEGHKGSILSLAVSPDGKMIASGSADHTIKIWDLSIGRCILTLHEHNDMVMSLCFSEDGRFLCSGSRDKLVKIWDIQMIIKNSEIESHNELVISADISPDQTECSIAFSSGLLKRFELPSGNLKLSLKLTEKQISFIKYIDHSYSLLYGGDKGLLSVWDPNLAEPILINSFPDTNQNSNIYEKPQHRWLKCFLLPDNKFFFVLSSKVIATVSLLNYKVVSINQYNSYMSDELFAYDVSPDGNCILMGNIKGKIREYDVSSETLQKEKIGRFLEYVNAASYHPDGDFIILCTSSGVRTDPYYDTNGLWLVNLKTHERKQLEGHSTVRDIVSCKFLSDGNNLMSGSKGGELLAWSFKDLRPVCRTFMEGGINRAFSVAGKSVLVSGHFSTSVYEIMNLE